MHVRLALAVLDGVGDGEHDLMQRLDQVVLALLPEARGKVLDWPRNDGVGGFPEIDG